VPTMGALHDGHLSLVREAMARAYRVIVTIFVNPMQFDRPDDLAAYPQTLDRDVALLTTIGAHLIYMPSPDTMYPVGFATKVSVSELTDPLCGAGRPGHFDGVATVVTKLFLQTGADLAVFGEKDFQQLAVIRRMAKDLDIPVELVGCPTIRDSDGLALSSRNVRLSDSERLVAPALYTALQDAGQRITKGESAYQVIADAHASLIAKGFRKIEYLELRASDDLERLAKINRPARLLAAAWLGQTRLIDNVALTP